MPPRRKPTSTTKKKAATKLKRAVKRGDLAPEPKKPAKSRHRGPPVSDAVQVLTVNLSKVWLRDYRPGIQEAAVRVCHFASPFPRADRVLAATLALTRPIPAHARLFPSIDSDLESTLTCPRRPKWRFDMTKIEVEHNEEGVFRKWLAETDRAVETWQTPPEDSLETTVKPFHFRLVLSSQTHRWRVTEISQIILVLLDSRAPLLHYPPSLASYLSDRRVILVLTKVDISGPARADAWTRYFTSRYPNLQVVQVESYIEKEISSLHQGRRQHDPHLPESFRRRLVEAIQQEHAAMLEPPEKIKNNPARLKIGNPAEGEKVGTLVGGPAAPAPHEDDSAEEEPKFLTIGLIGQPNVGKSSLLNALFGAHKVRASKTPGKTKHFQTLFWTPDVRLVDCPGLVMPNFVPMEMQVLAGILPISRVSAIPSCIHHAAELLPLERQGRVKEKPWTAMDVLTGYADAKGWVTAKAGRSDVHRAGNAIMRALAEGRVAWAFWPPDMDVDLTSESDERMMGWASGYRGLLRGCDEQSEEETDGSS
ncbi:hypothetical protein B0H13DRAFT_2229531 [Mycena leptocephala]|nr:hypothetical protein B0H13DRAFT_2229531 [Mycena leptocephala]